MFLIGFHGKLYFAPLKEMKGGLQNVLDIGTGTGIWAIDFGSSLVTPETCNEANAHRENASKRTSLRKRNWDRLESNSARIVRHLIPNYKHILKFTSLAWTYTLTMLVSHKIVTSK